MASDRPFAVGRNPNETRRGVVLLVLVGVALLLFSMTATMLIKVHRSVTDSISFHKYAQAFGMAQAARVYLHGAWLETSAAARIYKTAQLDPQGYRFVHVAAGYNYVYQDRPLAYKKTVSYALVDFQNTGWFGYVPLGSGEFGVIGAGGRGGIDARAKPYDVRMYLRYRPYEDKMVGGPYLDSSWTSVPGWAQLEVP